MTGAAGLGDDALELVDLLLGTTESSELGKEDSLVKIEQAGGVDRGYLLTRFFASFLARLSLLLRSNSITRRS